MGIGTSSIEIWTRIHHDQETKRKSSMVMNTKLAFLAQPAREPGTHGGIRCQNLTKQRPTQNMDGRARDQLKETRDRLRGQQSDSPSRRLKSLMRHSALKLSIPCRVAICRDRPTSFGQVIRAAINEWKATQVASTRRSMMPI